MRKYFTLLAALFGSILLLIFVAYRGISTLESNSDFKKVFSPNYSSLIIGTSREAKLSQSLITHSLNKDSTLFDSVFNYAFNLETSPQGPYYYENIKRKVDSTSNQQSVFIVGIDPWAVSAKESHLNDPLLFKERNTLISFVKDTPFPKWKYFFKYYTQAYYSLFIPKPIIDNGEPSKPDSTFIAQHIQSKMKNYEMNHFYDEQISDVRYSYFIKLISFLKDHGTVYVLRLPVSSQMIELERKYSTDFDEKLENSVRELNVQLIDFYPLADNFLCPDGNHLFPTDANTVSQIIGDVIRLNEANLLDQNRPLLESYNNSDLASYPLKK